MRDHWTCNLRNAWSCLCHVSGGGGWWGVSERGFEVEAVSHQRKQFTGTIVQRKSTNPFLAGTQIIDRAWRSLKNDWWPQYVNATSKVAGHTMMSDDIKAMVHQWVWSHSLGPATPFRLLEELKRLLKNWRKKKCDMPFRSSLEEVQNKQRQKTLSFLLKFPLCATAVYQACT